MNAIFSVCKPWSDMLVLGVKEYEFRGNKAKNINPGDKIYLYESKTNHGSGMVIGECEVAEIVSLTEKRVGPDKYFMRIFAEDTKNQKVLDALNKIDDFELSEYKNGTIFNFMFCEKLLDNIIKNDKYPDEVTNPVFLAKNPEIISQMNEAKKFMMICDRWLLSIGFYNYDLKSYYNTSYKLINPIKYENPLPITSFEKQNHENFFRAPQSWAYTRN